MIDVYYVCLFFFSTCWFSTLLLPVGFLTPMLLLHTIKTNWLSYLRRETQSDQIFLPVQWGHFVSKDNVCTLQPRLFKISPLIVFSFVLILWYIVLFIHVLSYSEVTLLLLFCYLVEDFTSSHLFILFF